MNEPGEEMRPYLEPTRFIDSDSREIIQFARQSTRGMLSHREKAVALYYRVRDDIRYDPYHIDFSPHALKASTVLSRGSGFCVEKAILLAASARALGIPSRLGFAIVRNHLTTERLRERMKTDVFVFHGFTELFLDERWVKATPVFNLSLCQRFGVPPLEFDGRHDSIFHPFDQRGHKYMEYLHDYGRFADLPYELMIRELRTHYPQFFEEGIALEGDFEADVSPADLETS